MKIAITRRSILSGKERTLCFEVTKQGLEAYQKGAHVQHAFPELSAEDREFFISGITADEWDSVFKED